MRMNNYRLHYGREGKITFVYWDSDIIDVSLADMIEAAKEVFPYEPLENLDIGYYRSLGIGMAKRKTLREE